MIMTEKEKEVMEHSNIIIKEGLDREDDIQGILKKLLNLIQKQNEENELLGEEIKFYNLRIDELTEENKKLKKFKKKYIEQYEMCKAQEVVLEKQDKIIDEMTLTIVEDTQKLGTFWCNGCNKQCTYSSVKDCIKQYFEKQVESESEK